MGSDLHTGASPIDAPASTGGAGERPLRRPGARRYAVLLGMFFAFVYGAIDHLGGHPFFAQGDPATASRCLYFSFTTIATVGYGDLTARTNLGHTLAVSEALVGQIYLVTIVSLIVANLGRRRDPSAATRRAP